MSSNALNYIYISGGTYTPCGKEQSMVFTMKLACNVSTIHKILFAVVLRLCNTRHCLDYVPSRRRTHDDPLRSQRPVAIRRQIIYAQYSSHIFCNFELAGKTITATLARQVIKGEHTTCDMYVYTVAVTPHE